MKGQAIRSLQELISVYHDTVGRNGVLELDFAIDRTGLVDPEHVKRYQEFGTWIRGCYGKPLVETSGNTTTLELSLPAGASVDRVVIQEDQRQGQRIRTWTLEQQASDGSWEELTAGTSVGNKRIALFNETKAGKLRLSVTSVDAPAIARFAAHAPCAVGDSVLLV
jgi:alpha-L-fucosidase